MVSQRGANIRLMRKLISEQEIRILFLRNNREAGFRVVGKASEPKSGFSLGSVFGDCNYGKYLSEVETR